MMQSISVTLFALALVLCASMSSVEGLSLKYSVLGNCNCGKGAAFMMDGPVQNQLPGRRDSYRGTLANVKKLCDAKKACNGFIYLNGVGYFRSNTILDLPFGAFAGRNCYTKQYIYIRSLNKDCGVGYPSRTTNPNRQSQVIHNGVGRSDSLAWKYVGRGKHVCDRDPICKGFATKANFANNSAFTRGAYFRTYVKNKTNGAIGGDVNCYERLQNVRNMFQTYSASEDEVEGASPDGAPEEGPAPTAEQMKQAAENDDLVSQDGNGTAGSGEKEDNTAFIVGGVALGVILLVVVAGVVVTKRKAVDTTNNNVNRMSQQI